MTTAPVRLIVLGALLAVVAGACSPEGSPSTTTTPTTTTTIAATTTTAPPDTTTTLPDQVTTDPNLPEARGRNSIPWDEVGPGWYLVMYDPSRAEPSGEGDIREGPPVLYLVNLAGDKYEIAAWEPGAYPALADATPHTALVARSGEVDETIYEVVDLATGAVSTAYSVKFPESSLISTWPFASLTRPDGANLVVHRVDDDTEKLERWDRNGTVLSVIFDQPYVEGETDIGWLYEIEGTSVVVSHHDGMTLVSNQGEILDDLWVPDDARCDPVRWWDVDTFLAVCYGYAPGSAPVDDTGALHDHYGRLWLIDTDGSPGTALTELSDEPPIIVDFGFHDAWPAEDDTILQWSGDCGASAVATLNDDGTGSFIEVTTPAEVVADGVRLIDVANGQMTLYGWQGCDGWIGTLFTTDLDGNHLNTLVSVIGDARGVTGVVGLATVFAVSGL